MAYMRVSERKRVTQEESSRIATAFGVQSYTTLWEHRHLYCEAKVNQFDVSWTVEPQPLRFSCIMLEHGFKNCEIYWNHGYRVYWSKPEFVPFLVSGLFRLGFKDWGIFDYHLNCLTAHEKVELMLSVPREYWPQKWREGAVV